VSKANPIASTKEEIMRNVTWKIQRFAALGIVSMLILGSPVGAWAHCDTLEGPVVKTARTALDRDDVTPLLKWVRADEEQNIRSAFQKTLAMRRLGPEAREWANRYFFETLVRVHRSGEGAPYTGLKEGAAVDPAVALADQALETGSVDKLIAVLASALADGIRDRFDPAYENRKHADDSIEMGREFVESYVIFTHYVEGLHGLIQGRTNQHGDSGVESFSGHHP